MTVDCAADLRAMPHTNVFDVTCRSNTGAVSTETFGLVGEHVWEAFGAFWDVYDKAKLPPDAPDAHNGLDLPPWDCMFTNEIDIDRSSSG